MDDATRMALASAELQKGIGHIKAAISLLSPIDRPSITDVRQKLVNVSTHLETCTSGMDA